MLTSRVTQTEIQMSHENRHNRIKNRDKHRSILMLEKQWEKFSLKRIELGENEAFYVFSEVKILQSLLNRMSYSFYMRFNWNSRVSIHDFESLMYERAIKIISEYNPHGQFYLYELIKNGMKQAGIDFLRKEGLTKKRKNNNTYYHKSRSLSLDNRLANNIPGTTNIEDEVITKVWINSIGLTANEKEVMKLYLDNSKVTLDDICHILNLKYRTEAQRILNKIEKKIVKSTLKDN